MSWKLQAICQTQINCTICAQKQVISEMSGCHCQSFGFIFLADRLDCATLNPC